MTDTSSFDWIINHRAARPSGPGLHCIIPDVFARYFLVPWTIGIMDNFPFDDYPASNWATADLNKQHAIERELGIFFRKDIDHLYREISRQELATRFDLPYTADTPALIKRSSGLAGMPDLFHRKIEHLLHQLPGRNELYLYVHDEAKYGFDNGAGSDDELLALDAIPDYLAFQDDTDWDTDSCLFPQDHAWCICTLEYFPHLFFCCSDDVFDSLAIADGPELFATHYDVPVGRQ